MKINTCKYLNDETNETNGKAMIPGLKKTGRSFYQLLQAENEDER
jgi:hypothetical protein